MSSIRVRAQIEAGIVTVRAIINHPMETGQRRDQAGEVIPAHYITKVQAQCNGQDVFTAHWGPAISRNPFLSFQFQGAAVGDVLKLSWTDNMGESDTSEISID
ncbi:sulfur-oxidizing protein SoxZ [Ectothiorhodospira magna]|uniref:Sulfur-oxidizing protein SoxZ n=1 Tax=Ectothiorhodospira magna TaxID=867345 RepID=A0A1H9B5A8_9GAMM|nr:thiosulfate oxidation carrier complex protein SoxZ [Ectothiorhodospira magna]SEP83428.1 sulfur-oxidizing protein SoxZ [Ectothiorhodospira magna]